MRGLMRLELDGADAHAAVTIDQHAIAASQLGIAGEVVGEVAGLLKADCDDARKIFAGLE